MTIHPDRPGESYMGQYLRTYKPRVNANRVINQLLTREVRAFAPGAVIVQEKLFPDVSFWQGDIDWDLMASKTDTIGIRAGQRNWPDTKFIRNYTEAKRRRMRRLVYWFCDDRESPGSQAKLLLDLIGNDPPEMGVYPDWEKSFGGAFRGLPNVVSMMEAIERGLPMCEVGLYTGFWWFVEHSNVILNINQYNYLKNKPLWLAWYTDNPAEVKIPGAVWTKLTHWQKGTPAVGRAYGADSEEIDMNVPNMTNTEFYTRYGTGDPVPDPDPEDPMPTLFGEVIVTELNIRPVAGTVFASLGKLKQYDLIEASEEVGGWWKLTSIKRGSIQVPLPASVCYAYEGLTNGYIRDLSPSPDPTPAPSLPVINVTVSGEGYLTQIIELRPR